MGTNFYAVKFRTVKCDHCGLEMQIETEPLHIGKRSFGWQFMFRAHMEDGEGGIPGVASATEWFHLLKRAIIRDEYGQTIDSADFWASVAATHTQQRAWHFDFLDEQNWAFKYNEFC